jgi:hypothetical protein
VKSLLTGQSPIESETYLRVKIVVTFGILDGTRDGLSTFNEPLSGRLVMIIE